MSVNFVNAQHCIFCASVTCSPLLHLLISSSSSSPSSKVLSVWCPVRVAVLVLEETTCQPARQTASPSGLPGLNCNFKTHYQAINPAIMLSNDLISLSVNPVSHQGPAVSSAAPPPRVHPAAAQRGEEGVAGISGPSQSAVIRNRIEASIFRKCVKAK